MSMEQQGPIDVIPLVGDDGKEYQCQVLHRFEFEDNEYVLLMDLAKAESLERLGDDEANALIVMRLGTRGNDLLFNVIDSDEEFNRVVAHVDEMIKRAELEESEAG